MLSESIASLSANWMNTSRMPLPPPASSSPRGKSPRKISRAISSGESVDSLDIKSIPISIISAGPSALAIFPRASARRIAFFLVRGLRGGGRCRPSGTLVVVAGSGSMHRPTEKRRDSEIYRMVYYERPDGESTVGMVMEMMEWHSTGILCVATRGSRGEHARGVSIGTHLILSIYLGTRMTA